MTPRVLSIPSGAPFLSTLAEALLEGRLVPGFSGDGTDPLRLAEATIYVPTRRAARALRDAFVEKLGGVAAILPTIRPLGEFDDDADIFEGSEEDELSLNPPIGQLDRILLLAPLVQAWKKRLPAHVAAMFGEDVVVPASLADAIWLARDLSGLMDEVETGGADWNRLSGLVPEDLANWWQVTLEFLEIVSQAWPALLAERSRSNPAAHRNAMIRAEAERLLRHPPEGPVIAAGSTGSIPATAQLLKSIALLPKGAVVLPGLDLGMDETAWKEIGVPGMTPASFGHPQAVMKKLLATLGIEREDVIEIGAAPDDIAERISIINEALRPAETTDLWVEHVGTGNEAAFRDVTLVEAANEREEALSIAVALRLALEDGTTAFVTGDRSLARRVAMELRRFGIEADDSGGTPLTATPPATLLNLMLEAAFRPGDAVTILALAKHPLLHAGFARSVTRQAAETLDLVALRGGVGRPDIGHLAEEFEKRYRQRSEDPRKPAWWPRLNEERLTQARALATALEQAVAPLQELRDCAVPLSELVRRTVECLEALGRDEDGSVTELYRGDAGDRLASFLRSLAGVEVDLEVEAGEWPDVLNALISGESVKASVSGDSRVSIWGALEARLQDVDTLVLGGLNEGSWPRKAEPDRFMSRFMKSDLELDPPERRIGQAAHDFVLAMGTRKVILTRAARSGDAPAIASRWLQRLETFAGSSVFAGMRDRGMLLTHWARELDVADPVKFAPRPNPTPPLDVRPTRFSVTEVETLRRDAYAIYARRILGLEALEPLLRDPGAAERGNLFHDIVHEFTQAGIEPSAPLAEDQLLKIGREIFDQAELPLDVDAVWWPRFARMAAHFIEWERNRPPIKQRISETRATETPIGMTGATLRGRADRIDLLAGGMADILDFKTGSSPSKAQAHTLLSPQLALEGALLRRGAFIDVGTAEPSQLAYVRMKANGEVVEETILEYKPVGQEKSIKSGIELSEEAWSRLEQLIAHFAKETTGYLSRALPFREGDVGGDYDHLARVLEWSAGGDGDAGGSDGE
ncbi:double-strand break repair protein AddB [Aquamicrobium zhengzhouense]|uniref:Double-strand break repair protein AddB n=1 Tax=Aquamicrobium zhengzhouense TaxID=2781738 RepID=A0ABS0SHQ0_9HYPH|nr:double-strand break repair protein AddB [Aquamicrobium zhengzhouense]MBI1622828.1 double-strand break repair protein AddB [Aquamicrobium zhengzhouense]